MYIYKILERCCRESIQRLKCDYIDLYQVHTVIHIYINIYKYLCNFI